MTNVAADTGLVWSAGAVVLRGQANHREVALVHRPSYLDWTLPKGKIEPGELAPLTAVREVEEEASIRIRLGVPLDPIRYMIPKGTKVVRFWTGHALRSWRRLPDSEVDDVRWVKVDQARQMMTYADERSVLEQSLGVPETTPLLIVRHAKSVPRKKWDGDDRRRPIDARGKAQIRYVNQLLEAYGVAKLASSSSTRCMQTLAPYANREALGIKPISLLTEEVGEAHLPGVERYLRKLAVKVGRSKVPMAVCGHRPVLPAMLSGLGIPHRQMSTAAVIVVHLDSDGRMVTYEHHESLRAKGL